MWAVCWESYFSWMKFTLNKWEEGEIFFEKWELRMRGRSLLSIPQSAWGADLGLSPRVGIICTSGSTPRGLDHRFLGRSSFPLAFLLYACACGEAENVSLPMNWICKLSVYPYQCTSDGSGVQGPPMNWIPVDYIYSTQVNMERLRTVKHNTLKCTSNGWK